MERAIADVFDRTAARSGSRPAVCEAGQDWTYAELRARSEDVSRCLGPLCRQPGQRIGLMVPNSAAFVAAFYGIARVGGVVAPLNFRYRSQELTYYLDDCNAVALVVSTDTVEQAREALAGMTRPPPLVLMDDAGSCRLLSQGHAEPVAAPAAGAPPLLQQYTSGSTGAPKRVIRTHENLLFELERLAAVFALGPDDRFLGAAPFSHVNGLVRTMMTSIFVGATLHPVREFRRREVLALIARERLTFFGGVPYMFVLLADTPVRGEVDLTSLRTAFSSSAPLLADDNRRFHVKYGLHVRQLYGSTETGTISVNLSPQVGECLESVGTPLPGVRIEIVDDHGAPLPPGHEGEVAIASPGAIRAYEGNPAASAASFRDGFYLSGDLGRMDGGGSLTLTGRKKFLINRGGYKVNPLEVEQAIQSHPKVREVVVVGVPGPHGDDIVRCVVVAREPCTAEEIVVHCQRRIADFKIPSRIEFRDALPKSETGKILRHKLA